MYVVPTVGNGFVLMFLMHLEVLSSSYVMIRKETAQQIKFIFTCFIFLIQLDV